MPVVGLWKGWLAVVELWMGWLAVIQAKEGGAWSRIVEGLAGWLAACHLGQRKRELGVEL